MESATRRRTNLSLVTLTVTLGLIVFGALRLFPGAEAWFDDVRVAFFSPAPEGQDDRVVVLTITEETLAQLPYRSPVDRGFVARLLDVIDAAGPRAIGFDLLLDQPTEPAKDAALLGAIRTAKAPVVLGYVHNAEVLSAQQRDYLTGTIESAQAIPGYVDFIVDPDGMVRRGADAIEPANESFAAALARLAGAPVSPVGHLSWRQRGGDMPPIAILPTHTVLQVAEVQPDIVAGWLANRIVLVGADLPFDDRHRTPLGLRVGEPPRTAGVLIHAHAVSQALDSLRVVTPRSWQVALMAVIAALVGGGVAALRWPLWATGLLVLILIAAWWILAVYLMEGSAVLLPMASPALAATVSFGAGSALLGYATLRQKRFVRKAFSQYVPAAVVDRIAADPNHLALGGERRELTFLFTDIAGFTAMSERMVPEQLGATLNRYLDGVSTIVFNHGGTLDKYIGDAIVAFFGAPVAQPDHAARAIACAAAIDRFAESFRSEYAAVGFGITRIGVNTGEAVVGNFGGEHRFDYTALGDAMNTAARLESVNKHLGTRVCISLPAVEHARATLALAWPLPELRPIGRLVLKGKADPVLTYELLGEGDWRAAFLSAYIAAFDAMVVGDVATAMSGFSDLPDEDALVAFHQSRLSAGAKDDLIVMSEK